MTDRQTQLESNRPAITHYEADHIGHVYAVYRDGSVWPTGVTLPGLAGMNEISKRVFRAELREGRRG